MRTTSSIKNNIPHKSAAGSLRCALYEHEVCNIIQRCFIGINASPCIIVSKITKTLNNIRTLRVRREVSFSIMIRSGRIFRNWAILIVSTITLKSATLPISYTINIQIVSVSSAQTSAITFSSEAFT